MSWNIFKSKPREPVKVKVGKGTVQIVTLSGQIYKKEIVGSFFYWGNDDIATCHVRRLYKLEYIETDNKFISIDETISIPICNIETMSFMDVDDSYEVPSE